MFITVFRRMWFAVKYCKKDIIISAISIFCIIWTILDAVLTITKASLPDWSLFALSLLSIVLGFFSRVPPFRVVVELKFCNSRINILFGDIFKQKGQKVISANEYFDSRLGEHVSPNSIHGKFIKKVIKDEAVFENLIDASLVNEAHVVVSRPNGRKKKYPIGTVSFISFKEKGYYCVALGRTDVTTLQASANINDLDIVLSGLWGKVRKNHNGEDVSLPLIGAGLSRTGLPIVAIVNLIISSFYIESKKNCVAQNLNIVISTEHSSEFDISSIAKNWR